MTQKDALPVRTTDKKADKGKGAGKKNLKDKINKQTKQTLHSLILNHVHNH